MKYIDWSNVFAALVVFIASVMAVMGKITAEHLTLAFAFGAYFKADSIRNITRRL